MSVVVTPPEYRPSPVEKAAAWNPWRALRARSDITFAFSHVAARAGGAAYLRQGDLAAIIVDPALPRRERAAALAHELVHDERFGGGQFPDAPDTWGAVVARDELQVHREVARRLVPADALREYCERLATTYEPVRVTDVAEEFDVAADVALMALRLLVEEGR